MISLTSKQDQKKRKSTTLWLLAAFFTILQDSTPAKTWWFLPSLSNTSSTITRENLLILRLSRVWLIFMNLIPSWRSAQFWGLKDLLATCWISQTQLWNVTHLMRLIWTIHCRITTSPPVTTLISPDISSKDSHQWSSTDRSEEI